MNATTLNDISVYNIILSCIYVTPIINQTVYYKLCISYSWKIKHVNNELREIKLLLNKPDKIK